MSQAVRHGTRTPLGDIRTLLPAPPGVVFDVGANIGYVANDFHKAWPDAQVFCFEPTPQTYAHLVDNVGSEQGVRCYQLAVSDSDGTATFRVDNKTHGGGSNSLLGHSEEFGLNARADRFQGIEVPTVRLDSFCSENGVDHIDLLKLDIEGAEPMALHGAGGLLESSAIDVILSEVRLVPGHEGGVLMHELVALLAEWDHRPYGIYHFAESIIGQSLFGDAVFLGPRFRRRLLELRGAKACGFVD